MDEPLTSIKEDVVMDVAIWTYRAEAGYDPTAGVDLTGFKVEAVDGSIGKVDEATDDVSASQIVVDTGPWILGKKVVVPAGIIDRIDVEDEKVYVHRTKDEIKNSPKFGDVARDDTDREAIAGYYGRGGAGYRDW
jgi:hypothetical protein